MKLALSTVRRRRANFLLLSPPSAARQKVLDRRAGITRTFSIQDGYDYRTLTRVFGDEAYRLDRLARGDALTAIYRRIVGSSSVPVILDCGADIGLSAQYFASAFPQARVLAIEPSSDNIGHAKENCMAPSVEVRQAAIASECRRDEKAGLDFVSVNSLVAEQCAAGGSPFIMRIDIEAFEDDLFSRNVEWVDEFPLLIVEGRDWQFPSRHTSRHVLRTLADADREFVFVGDSLFSIANDETTFAIREAYQPVPRRIAPYRVEEALPAGG